MTDYWINSTSTGKLLLTTLQLRLNMASLGGLHYVAALDSDPKMLAADNHRKQMPH